MGALNDPDNDNLADAGDTITYSMYITNKGNVRMSDIQVRDGGYSLAKTYEGRSKLQQSEESAFVGVDVPYIPGPCVASVYVRHCTPAISNVAWPFARGYEILDVFAMPRENSSKPPLVLCWQLWASAQ